MMEPEIESSTSEQLNEEDEQGWEDVHEETETVTIVSLFDERVFPDVKQMLKYCKDNYHFDIWQVRRDLGSFSSLSFHPPSLTPADLEFLELIKLVNYIRTNVKEGNPKPDVSSKSPFDKDIYLKPVLDDDALLYSLDDAFDDEPDINSPTTALESEITSLRDQVSQLQSQFSAYRTDVQRSLLQNLNRNDSPAPQDNPASSSSKQPPTSSRTSTQADADYFTSYAHLSIHSLMLRDTTRTSTYRDFIYDNKHLFLHKTILDVGCGTGILSMFCAHAGAKLVIAVDNSSIIDKARENVFRNNLSDRITCLRGKIEDVTLPVAQVDIVVSEWMGYCLLYESMLDSVIYARDRYLRPNGLMVPSHATLKIAPLADSELRDEHIDFWKDVYGFDMSSMLTNAYDEVLMQTVDKKEVVGQGVVFKQLDLHTVTVQDLSFSAPFKLNWQDEFNVLDGFVVWFDMFFGTSPHQTPLPPGAPGRKEHEEGPKSFSTGPFTERTHWYQGILLLEDPQVDMAAGTKIEGDIKYLKVGDSERSVDIEVEWEVEGRKKSKQLWKLE